MRLRLERVLFDGNGKEISRKPIGEYSTELDAIVAMQQVPQFSLVAMGRDIQVAGARVGSTYAVLDLQGGVIMQGHVGAAHFNLDMPHSGTFLVRIGREVQKVSLK